MPRRHRSDARGSTTAPAQHNPPGSCSGSSRGNPLTPQEYKKLIAEHYHPDLIMIPIGGHFVMNPQDAAFATKAYFKPKHAIPMHYGTNPFLVGTPAEYIKAMGKTPTKIHDMKPGDKLEF